MDSKVIHERWVVLTQALGLASAWVISIGMLAGVIGIVAYSLTGGASG